MDITVKKMETDGEIRAKAYVHWKAWQETYPGMVDQSYLDSLTLEKCEEIAFRKRDCIIIASDGGSVVGFAGYGAYRGEDLKDAGELQAIYVLFEYWGRGVGKALMEAALDELKEFSVIALWVLEKNSRAIRFYEKCGFSADGTAGTITLGSPVTEIRMILEKH